MDSTFHNQFLRHLPFYNITDLELTNEFINNKLLCNKHLTSNGLTDLLKQISKNDDFKSLDCKYYTDAHFNNLSKSIKPTVELSVYHLNIRSLNASHTKLCQFLQVLDFEFDVIILSEIWTYNIESYCNILEGYTFLYDLPLGTNIGGIGIYVKNTFHVKEMQHLKITTSVDSKIENIWLEICSPDKQIHSWRYLQAT